VSAFGLMLDESLQQPNQTAALAGRKRRHQAALRRLDTRVEAL
jgi:hypothetical protein